MRLSNIVGCTLCHCSDMKTPVPRSMAYEGKLCKFCKQSYPFSSFILSSAVEVLALTVLNLSSNFVIFCFACDFLANFNIQFLWKKIRASTGLHSARRTRPVSSNQCNKWTRQGCRNHQHNSFLIHKIPSSRTEKES